MKRLGRRDPDISRLGKGRTGWLKISERWAKSSLVLYVVLTSSFLVVVSSAPPAHGACSGAGTKYNATAEGVQGQTAWGNFGLNTPSKATLCGSSWSEGSYVHLANSMTTRSDGLGWIEVMWYFGYRSDGGSSTMTPAFQWIKHNIWAGGRSSSDISKGTSIYPNFGDAINMTLRYDWTDSSGKDFYKIVIYDITSGRVIIITNLWVDGRGAGTFFQSEGFNLQNVLKGNINGAQFMDTSKVWHYWKNYNLYQAQGGQEFCVQALAGTTTAFKFGTYINGVCSLP